MSWFQKNYIGGFNCVKTRLSLHSQILLPKDNIDYDLNIKIIDANRKQRITTKILKIDKNNQYG